MPYLRSLLFKKKRPGKRGHLTEIWLLVVFSGKANELLGLGWVVL